MISSKNIWKNTKKLEVVIFFIGCGMCHFIYVITSHLVKDLLCTLFVYVSVYARAVYTGQKNGVKFVLPTQRQHDLVPEVIIDKAQAVLQVRKASARSEM